MRLAGLKTLCGGLVRMCRQTQGLGRRKPGILLQTAILTYPESRTTGLKFGKASGNFFFVLNTPYRGAVGLRHGTMTQRILGGLLHTMLSQRRSYKQQSGEKY